MPVGRVSPGALLVLFLNLLRKLPVVRVLPPSLPRRVGFLSPTELSGPFGLAVGSLSAVGVDVLLLLSKLLLRELLQRLKRLLEIEGDLESLVEVPAELLLLERAAPVGFVVVGVRVLVDGARLPILLPRREVQRELMRLLGLMADGLDVLDVGEFVEPMGPPMREVPLELAGLRELGAGCRLVLELELDGVCRLKMLLDGLRVKIELLVCVEVLRLGAILLDELLDGALLGREMLGLVVLLKPVNPEGLEVLDLVGALEIVDLVGALNVLDLVGDLRVLELVEGLLDRVGLVTLVEGLLTLGADEGLELEDDRLLTLLLDLELLLRRLPSATGSVKQEKARASVTRAISGICLYFRVHILLLLSSALVLGR